jgi:hypothetical protein
LGFVGLGNDMPWGWVLEREKLEIKVRKDERSGKFKLK